MAAYEPKQIVVIGTSAGGLEALRSLVAALPTDFPGSVCIVMHTSPQSPGVLHEILNRAGKVPVTSPRNVRRSRPDASTWRRRTITWWSNRAGCA